MRERERDTASRVRLVVFIVSVSVSAGAAKDSTTAAVDEMSIHALDTKSSKDEGVAAASVPKPGRILPTLKRPVVASRPPARKRSRLYSAEDDDSDEGPTAAVACKVRAHGPRPQTVTF